MGALEQTERALTAINPSQPVPAASPRWVYLGIEKNGVWNPNYLHLKEMPKPGLKNYRVD